ncbi:MAG: c-type cytochrome [Myxococcota bacterium]
MKKQTAVAMCMALLALSACRGQPSEQPPVHLNPNMDTQEKYKAQSVSRFFEDRRTMRMPVEGTVARGNLKEDDAFFRGKEGDTFIGYIPTDVTDQTMARGQERYNIYCAPCHDQTGAGKGIVATRGLVPPPSYHEDRIRNMPEGELFNVISNGVRTMPAYRNQIPESDRWAIVGYIRALQRAQLAKLEDVPAEKQQELK